VVLPTIRSTREEVASHWRSGAWAECGCGRPAVDVVIYSDYGFGFHWPGKACFDCLAITDGLLPYGDPVTGLDRPTWGPHDGRPEDCDACKLREG
jgi:hypothetical protein